MSFREDEEMSAWVLGVIHTALIKGSADRLPAIQPLIEHLLLADDSLRYV